MSLPISSPFQGSTPTDFDIFPDKLKCPKLQRVVTHEVFFSECIQKLIRSSTHHYQYIYQVSRL